MVKCLNIGGNIGKPIYRSISNYKDISQNMHVDVVLSELIHPCSKKRRRAQFSIHAELTRLSVCVCFRCVCVRALQISAHTIPSVLYAHLVPSGSPYIEF